MSEDPSKTIERLRTKIRELQARLDARKRTWTSSRAGGPSGGRMGAVLAFANGRFDEALALAARRQDKTLHQKMKAFVVAFRGGSSAYSQREIDKATVRLNEALVRAQALGGLAQAHVGKVHELLGLCFYSKGLLELGRQQYSTAFTYFSVAKRHSPQLTALRAQFEALERKAKELMRRATQNPSERTTDGRSFCKLHLLNAARMVRRDSKTYKQIEKTRGSCR